MHERQSVTSSAPTALRATMDKPRIAPWMLVGVFSAVYLLVAMATRQSYHQLVLTLVVIWATVGVAWNLFSGYCGLLSFGHAAFFGLGAYTVSVLATYFGVTPWIGIAVGTVAGALAGAIIGLPTFRLRGIYFALAMLAYPQALIYLFEWLGLQELSLPLHHGAALAWMQFDDPRVYTLLALALLATALLVNLRITGSRFGLSMLAIKHDELAAQAAGIHPLRWKMLALMLSAALTAAAGGLYAVVIVIVTPSSAFSMLVSAQALIVALFGGIGTVAGPVIGSVVLIPMGEFLRAVLGDRFPGIQGVVFGLAIVLVVLMAPQGLLPMLRNVWRRRALGPAPNAPAMDSTPATGTEAVPDEASIARARLMPDASGKPMLAGAPLLVVRGLSKRFGGVHAVQGLGFEVLQGEILGIIGPNGAGKSTLFNLLNGLVVPSEGQVELAGKVLRGLPPYRICRLGIGRTFQVVRAFTRLSVLQNVVVGAFGTQSDDAQAYACAVDALELVGLRHRAATSASSLSTMELRQMELARALASRPQVLLLDETLAGLGAAEVETMVRIIQQVRDSGVTVVIIEHTMHAMVRLADRLLVLDHGRVLAVGMPSEVLGRQEVVEAYLGKRWAKRVAN